MKKFVSIIGVLIIIFVIIVYAQQSEVQTNNYHGRYQILVGTYKFSGVVDGNFASYEEKAIFKIDTETGNVWRYIYILDEGESVECFQPIATEPPLSFESYLNKK